MDTFKIFAVLGAFCVIIGIANMKGNLSTIHWYHRQRLAEEDKLPFGRKVGFGTIIIGISLITYGAFAYVSETLQSERVIIIGAIILAVGIVVGLGMSLYAMIKYNKGIF